MIHNQRAIQYNLEIQEELHKYLKPLFENFPVKVFLYGEYLGNEEYFHISSEPAISNEMLHQAIETDMWVDVRKACIANGGKFSVIWANINSKDEIGKIFEKHECRYGFSIYQQHGNLFKIWCFMAEDEEKIIYLQTHKELLEKFILHFNFKCHDIINCERARKSTASWKKSIDLSAKNEDIKSNPFEMLTVSLNYNGQQFSLTTRQWEILKHLSLGMGMKEIGSALKISPRTVEKVLEIIKEKTGLSVRTQLVDLVNKNSLSI
jgi:DNA-binding CsgD family transcriptional regulator